MSDGAIDPQFLRGIAHKLGRERVREQLADPGRRDIYATCAGCGAAHRLEVEGRPMVAIEIKAGTPMTCDCGVEGVLQPDEGGGWIVIEPLPPELGGTPRQL